MRTIYVVFVMLWCGSVSAETTGVSRKDLAKRERKSDTLFAALTPEESGIAPVLVKDPNHPLGYFYGSGIEASGVATGDIDGDGRPDVFLASAPGMNKLYRQVSPLKFEDITAGSGLESDQSFSRGASMVDIDNDGDQDIYVVNYGQPNALYINEGTDGKVPVKFSEMAGAFGLATMDACLMPAFCDYDLDGDLDMYLVTNEFIWPPTNPVPELKEMLGQSNGKPVLMPPYDKFFRITGYRKSAADGFDVKIDRTGQADYLYRNNGDGTFTDVTVAAGMEPGNGRGLSATWWDYNNDGLMDLYVGNDWADRDYLYENQGDGTFRDVIADAVPYSSMFSMGADTGDLNGDGLMDFMIADMAGTTHYKKKISMGAMKADQLDFMINARPTPNMRNMVFLGTGTERLIEAGQMMGLANTDWSWAVKIADFDNDGRSDVFVTNGMEQNVRQMEGGSPGNEDELFNEKNLALRNEGDLRFVSKGTEWGLDHYGFSLAAATCDFDRDGDLDALVIHRGEMPTLYENTSAVQGLLVKLHGRESNRDGLGAIIRMETSEGVQVRDVRLSRGYLSSDEAVSHFGLGQAKVKSLTVDWPSGHRQTFADISAGGIYEITEPEGAPGKKTAQPLAKAWFAPLDLNVRHDENVFDDFELQRLLPNRLSQLGPGVAAGDVDNDGDDDFALGGALGSRTKLAFNDGSGNFVKVVEIPGSEKYEDMGLLFLDADADGDLDLYVVSGGVELRAAGLRDRLYLNDGSGVFSEAEEGTLPPIEDSGGSVAAADVDRDGDLDLFICGRVVPGEYPSAAQSRLLMNDSGKFTVAQVPALTDFGMATGAEFADIDGDGWQDLLVAREWGSVAFLRNDKGKLIDQTAAAGLAEHSGWWNGVATGDFDRDGDVDFVATNFGLNTKYHATAEHPALLYYGKFGTDTMQVVEAEFEGKTLFPVRGRSCSTQAMPHLGKKFQTFHSFALADLEEIYTEPVLENATKFAATNLSSGVFLNDGKGRFVFHPLRRLAQIAPGFGIVVGDLDGDGILDLYLAQNFYTPQPETGRMSGGVGLLLRGKGDGDFEPMWPKESGVIMPEDAKGACIADLNADGSPDLLLSANNGPARGFVSQEEGKWVQIKLRSKAAGNPNAIGARVTVSLPDGSKLMQEVHAGSGYLGQSAPALYFPGGAENASVRWSDGHSSEHPILAGKEKILLSE